MTEQKKQFGLLVNHRMIMSHQCDETVKKPYDAILGFIRRGISHGDKKVLNDIVSGTAETLSGLLCTVLVKKDKLKLEKVERKVIGLARGITSLQELGLFSLT